MQSSHKKPPISFWIIAILSLIWNAIGVYNYLIRAFSNEAYISNLPEMQRAEFVTDFPIWYTAAFATAVFIGLSASIVMIMRKPIAFYLFVVSGLAVIIQHIYISLYMELMVIYMPSLVIITAVFLVWYSKYANSKGWMS